MKAEDRVNYIQKLSFYVTENTTSVYYKDLPLNTAYGHNRCSL